MRAQALSWNRHSRGSHSDTDYRIRLERAPLALAAIKETL
jgi:hypothetical protein